MLCVNCDWDSVVYNGRDKGFDRQSRPCVCGHQTRLDGGSGQLDRQKNVWYFSIAAAYLTASVSVHNVVETEYREGTAGFDFSRHISWLAEEQTGALTMEEYRTFLRDLEETYRDGTYLFFQAVLSL